jgi:hypothetical protein
VVSKQATTLGLHGLMEGSIKILLEKLQGGGHPALPYISEIDSNTRPGWARNQSQNMYNTTKKILLENFLCVGKV